MVLHKYGDMLYKGLSKLVEEHLAEVSARVAAAVDDVFLGELNKAWTDHKVSMLMIRDILMYLDRVYVMHHHVPPVYDLGLIQFRDNVARQAKIKPRLLKMMLDLVLRERRGEMVERGVLRSLTQMMVDVGVNSRAVYEEDFERAFLETSATFYRAESGEFITSNSCSDYMRKAEQRIREELERVATYMDAGTEPKIKEVVERELIANHMKTLLEMENSGVFSLVRDDKVEDLQRMYALLGRVQGGHQAMRDMVGAYVRDVGRVLVTDEERLKNPVEFVQALLDLRAKCDVLLDRAFGKDKAFLQAVSAAFENFVNLAPRSPEFLSLFIDDKLKKGLRGGGASEDETDAIFDRVIVLFRYVQEKDVFERYYKQHLAKRLLLGRSASDDAEKGMIAKLKTEVGYQFTSKLEGMFTDMKVSADTMEGFKQWVTGLEHPPKVDLSVQVLTTGFWPTQATAAMCNLPPEIAECCELFRKHYLSRHSGRRLSWQTNLGTSDVRAVLNGEKHELSVSTHQMVVLMLFNDRPRLGFREIQETTAIPIPDLKRALLALSCGKVRVLAKTPAQPADRPTVDESDSFAVNPKFHSKLYRIKVMALGQREAPAEVADTRQKVDEDRKL
jgi:cullin 3